jgi:hypothetical protein
MTKSHNRWRFLFNLFNSALAATAHRMLSHVGRRWPILNQIALFPGSAPSFRMLASPLLCANNRENPSRRS